jgi:hypothetical protein
VYKVNNPDPLVNRNLFDLFNTFSGFAHQAYRVVVECFQSVETDHGSDQSNLATHARVSLSQTSSSSSAFNAAGDAVKPLALGALRGFKARATA